MNCPECDNDMGELVDTTYSNIKTNRANIGQHTGNIYRCDNCECFWLDNFLTNKVELWYG